MPNVRGFSTEAEEQTALFQWAGYVPELDYMFAIPNGGSRNVIEAANLKRQGVKAGVPDIFLPVPRGPYHGLWIEMKVKPNKLTEKQRDWLAFLSRMGYRTAVCYGMNEARRDIVEYMQIGRERYEVKG
ncbi:MAG: VRR-NUC domain-containing protein [Provencibacterium sp.]|jgi:hypothetical protein|nr:VRR-NUC domain-containing protein [Provencibacterium sp.]